ncbi:hypothetical protein, partial [Klebsiella aerogenes]|uniref:hypothetical protein n=1 Tax=Klebsiella aerogenes TaxID=548 RepID=UPI001954CEDB
MRLVPERRLLPSISQARHGGLIHDGSVRQWLALHENQRYATLRDEQFVKKQQHLMDQYEKSRANIFDRSPLD